MPSQPPVPAPEEYLSKEIAAKRLGLSVRRLMELSQAGKIERYRRTDPRSGRDAAIFAAADIERLKSGSSVKIVRQKPRPAASGVITALPPAALPLRFPAISRPWLTLAEAAEYSGLPAAFLVRLIDRGTLRAFDVGVRPGGRLRLRRSDLDEIQGDILDGTSDAERLR